MKIKKTICIAAVALCALNMSSCDSKYAPREGAKMEYGDPDNSVFELLDVQDTTHAKLKGHDVIIMHRAVWVGDRNVWQVFPLMDPDCELCKARRDSVWRALKAEITTETEGK